MLEARSWRTRWVTRKTAGAGFPTLVERASSDTGLHLRRVSDAPSALTEVPGSDWWLSLSINTQSCYRFRCLGGNIWDIPVSYTFHFRDVWRYQDLLFEGAWLTLQLSAVTMLFGLLLGILGAGMKTSQIRSLRWAAKAYVDVIRNTPLLVQLFIVFFGLPSVGIRLDPTPTAVITLSINIGAYATEIVRAGVEAIPRSQIEAGLSLGMSRLEVFRHVVLLPALKIIYPALASQFILLLIATSIVSQIATEELFHMGAFIESRTFRSLEVYLVVTGMYLVMALSFRAVFGVVYRLLFVRRRAGP